MLNIDEIRDYVLSNTEEVLKTIRETYNCRHYFYSSIDDLIEAYVSIIAKGLTVEEAMNMDYETQEYFYDCYCNDESFGEGFEDALDEIVKQFC